MSAADTESSRAAGQANHYRQRSVLITGGAGFIGSNLARRLVRHGAKVTVTDSLIPQYGGNTFNLHDLRDRIEFSITDVRDRYAMAHLVQGQHVLFNLAGQTSHLDSMDDPQTDLEINATAQLSILEACRRHNPAIKVVFASTRQIYGRPAYLPVDQNHPIRPIDVNGINKLAGESYHLLYNDIHGIRACALRLTNTYGPGMRVKDARQTFLGIWIRRLIDGIPFQIFGDGTQLRDFNFVDDCVDALLLAGASDSANGKAYNLGSREVVSLRQLADLLVAIEPSARYEIVEFPPERKAIDIGDYYGDFSPIHADLGWEPTTRLADGLRQTVDYYRRHRGEYWEPGS
jgi:UDP-glucose 4-epimerase